MPRRSQLAAALCAATLLLYVWHSFSGAPQGAARRPALPAQQPARRAVAGGALAALAERLAEASGSEPAAVAGARGVHLPATPGDGSGVASAVNAAAVTPGADGGDGGAGSGGGSRGGSAGDLSAGLTSTRCASIHCAERLESREPAWVNLTFQPGIDWLGGGVRGDCVAGELEYLWPKYCSPPQVPSVVL